MGRIFSIQHNRWFGAHNPFGRAIGKARDPYINKGTLARLTFHPLAEVRTAAISNLAHRIASMIYRNSRVLDYRLIEAAIFERVTGTMTLEEYAENGGDPANAPGSLPEIERLVETSPAQYQPIYDLKYGLTVLYSYGKEKRARILEELQRTWPDLALPIKAILTGASPIAANLMATIIDKKTPKSGPGMVEEPTEYIDTKDYTAEYSPKSKPQGYWKTILVERPFSGYTTVDITEALSLLRERPMEEHEAILAELGVINLELHTLMIQSLSNPL